MSGQGTPRVCNAGSVGSGVLGHRRTGHTLGSRLQAHACGAMWSRDQRPWGRLQTERVCNVGSALPVLAYHTCYDRARVLHERAARRGILPRRVCTCEWVWAPNWGARTRLHVAPWGVHGHRQRHHTGYRVPWGARGLGRAERYLDMPKPPSLPLLTRGVKRAGPVFLLGEGEGSQGRIFSAFAYASHGSPQMPA
jgi:hypothetical protein